MESSAIIKSDFNDSTLFQIAARIEEVAALPPIAQTAAAAGGEKIAGAKTKAAKLKASESKKVPAKKAAKDMARNKNDAAGDGRKITKFCFEAPEAKLVKLAADFTDWEKTPLEMVKTDQGIWAAVIPLPPGHYAYRFIVDGQWCDDPHPVKSAPNPFGTTNSVIEVA